MDQINDLIATDSRQSIKRRRIYIATMKTDIVPTQVIGHDYNHIGSLPGSNGQRE